MKEEEVRPLTLFNRYLELARQDCASLLLEKHDFVDVDCPACAAPKKHPAFEKIGFRYVLCDKCETLYVSPRPTPNQLNEFYSGAKSVRFWSEHFYRETSEARREKIFSPRAELVQSIASKFPANRSMIVDVGAGYGVFLEESQRLNSFDRFVAIEPNPELADECRRRSFEVVQSRVEDIAVGTIQAGCAVAFEILEHVFSPLDFLIAIRNLLSPGGILLLTTLTVTGFDIQVLWEHSKSVHPPHHINLVSVRGLERLMDRAGLRIVEILTPGQLDVDIVLNASREDSKLPLPRFVSQLLKSDDQTRQDFQQFLSGHRLSSHVRVIATPTPRE